MKCSVSVSDSGVRASICLNMIVKNEAHIVHEVIEAVAPYIDYWVIVDTGSDDGTQDVIRGLMSERGIPGELHERPWVDFGHNRTEALELAQGNCDYIWLMDADDTIAGRIDFTDLTADGYQMRIEREVVFWRLHLFRDGVPWRFSGVLHESAVCDAPHTEERLEGDYRIVSRDLGSRGRDPMHFHRDCEVLLAAVQRDPSDAHSVFYLAQTYECLSDLANARIWWERFAQLGDRDEVVYYAMLKSAVMMESLGEPWPEVRAAYLRAWEYRPTRAEALEAIAFHYLAAGQYELGYLFASRAAQIPVPEADTFFVFPHTHQWRTADEQAVCASWIGRQSEALRIWRRLLKRDDVPEADRHRMLENRDLMMANLLEVFSGYQADLVERPTGRPGAEVTVSVVAGPDPLLTEMTINSFIRCCSDIAWVGRFVIVDVGLSVADRAVLAQRYPFAELVYGEDRGAGRYVLDLRQGWRFFTEESLVARLVGVLEAESGVGQVGINLGDAWKLSEDSPARVGVRSTPSGCRYVLTDSVPRGPVMIDTTRPGGGAATLDEVLCVRV